MTLPLYRIDATVDINANSTSAPLNVAEQSAEPSGPVAEDVYLDDGTNTASGNPGWRRYTGAAWEDVSATAGGAGGAPTGAEYVLLSANSTTTAERVLTAGAALAITDGGVSTGTVTVDVDVSKQSDIGTPASGDLLVVEDITDGSIKKVQWSETGGVGTGGGDSTTTDVYASRGAASNDGDLFFPSDGFSLQRDTSAAWIPWGPVFPYIEPVDGGFAWINQGAASITATKGGLYLTAAGTAAHSWRIRKKSAPSAPYTLIVGINPLFGYIDGSDLNWVSVIFRQSSDGKMHHFTLVDGSTSVAMYSSKWTDETTFSAHYKSYASQQMNKYGAGIIWLKIEDNSTNRILSFSSDKYHWNVFHTIGRTDFLTADEIGFGTNNDDSITEQLLVVSWEEG